VPEVIIRNPTNFTMRYPVAEQHADQYADVDIAAAGGEYIELEPANKGALGASAVIPKAVWDRMRLRFDQLREWEVKQKISVLPTTKGT